MSDSPPSTAWPIICGVLAVLFCCASIAASFLFLTKTAEASNWKRRWNDDTTFFANEVKAAAQQTADASTARMQAERRIAELEAELEALRKSPVSPPTNSSSLEKTP